MSSTPSTTIAVATSGVLAGICAYHWYSQRKLLSKHKVDLATIPIPTFDGSSSSDAGLALTFDSDHDNIFQRSGPKPFCFNQEVVRVFDDMISRSVPLYRECIFTLLYWVSRYYQPGSRIYDLGSSTGSTLDFVAQSLTRANVRARFVGIDNSEAMVEKAREKLEWVAEAGHDINVIDGDLMHSEISDATIVIMNYTLQFISVSRRPELLRRIFNGLRPGGVLYISEKVRYEDSEMQETCTWIYEDYKNRRGYTKTEIARKKEALMNVLVPYSESELITMLKSIGFNSVEIALKWNNFTTFVALKAREDNTNISESVSVVDTQEFDANCASHEVQDEVHETRGKTKRLQQLFEEHPTYLRELVVLQTNKSRDHKTESKQKNQDSRTRGASTVDYESQKLAARETCFQRLLTFREEYFQKRMQRASGTGFERAAECLALLPDFTTSHCCVTDDSVLEIGREDELQSEEHRKLLNEFLNLMKPWKKGPLKLFGVSIQTEWRSDWKWNRIRPHVDDLEGKVVADLGCANGYFMYRMALEAMECGKNTEDQRPKHGPRLVIGIDPNVQAWLEFEFFQRYAKLDCLRFEVMDGDCMEMLEHSLDVVFCLGVLYHTTDPIGMLRKIWLSMKPGGQLIVDCQGIPEQNGDPMCLFPRSRYANAKGIWFLPTLEALLNWLARTNFIKAECFFAEALSTEEQRANSEWANIKSLKEALVEDTTTASQKTIEGYPVPYRYYVKCRRG